MINFKFLPPLRQKILFYDKTRAKQIADIFKLKNIGILHTRKESINLFILLKCFFKFKVSFFSYLQEYVSFCKPKVLITFIDNDERFYKIKCNSGLKLFIQNGRRSKINDVLNILKKPNSYHVDYMLTHNPCIGKIYKKFITGKIISCGSIFSNDVPIKRSIKKNLIYISSFRVSQLDKKKILFKNISFQDYIKYELILLKLIYKFCVLNNIKLEILGSSKQKELSSIEEEFFKKNISNKIIFHKNFENRNNFFILDKYEITVATESTLAYEVFGRGKKVAFFNARKCKGAGIESKKFAWPYKVNNKGFFWTDKINYKEISRIFNNLRSCSVKEWKKKSSFLRRMNMTYDFRNKKINILMRKLIVN